MIFHLTQKNSRRKENVSMLPCDRSLRIFLFRSTFLLRLHRYKLINWFAGCSAGGRKINKQIKANGIGEFQRAPKKSLYKQWWSLLYRNLFTGEQRQTPLTFSITLQTFKKKRKFMNVEFTLMLFLWQSEINNLCWN